MSPQVTAVDPKSGSSNGGTAVVIQGSGFTGATAVTFGFTAATTFAVIDDGHINAVTPSYDMRDYNGDPLTQAYVDVIVTTPSGTSGTGQMADMFEFVVPTTTTSLDPIDPVTQLRTLIGERIKPGKQDTDTLFTDDELSGMIIRHNGNLYLAAAEGWQGKAAEYASLVDVNESGSSRNLSQLFRQAFQMANSYQKAGEAFYLATIDRPIARTASYLDRRLGGPNDRPLGVNVFDPWWSATARWWPLLPFSGAWQEW